MLVRALEDIVRNITAEIVSSFTMISNYDNQMY